MAKNSFQRNKLSANFGKQRFYSAREKPSGKPVGILLSANRPTIVDVKTTAECEPTRPNE